MRKIYIVIIAAIAIALGIQAQVTEIITMRDGNVYIGSIMKQNSRGEIRFMADTSLVYLPMAEIERIQRYTSGDRVKKERADIYLSSVPVPEDTSAVANSFVTVSVDSVYVDDFEYVTVDSVALDQDNYPVNVDEAVEVVEVTTPMYGDVIKNVELLEEGAVIKYRSTEPQVITLMLKDIAQIKRPMQDKSVLNGLKDEITTNNGQVYKGFIVNTEPGKGVRINVDGKIFSILSRDIRVQRKVAIDPEESIYSQSPVLDNIYLVNGKGTIYDVVMIEQNYGKGTFDVVDRHNVINRRKLSDISEIRKEANRDYNPRREIFINPDSVYVNEEGIPRVSYDRKGKNIKIAFRNTPILKSFSRMNGCVKIYTTDDMAARRMVLFPLGSNFNREVNINPSELVSRSVPVQSQTLNKRKDMLIREYQVTPGYYAFIDTENAKISIFRVY